MTTTRSMAGALIIGLVVALGSASTASAKDCRPVHSKNYAPGHTISFYVGGDKLNCGFARRAVRRIVANHARWLPDGWVCQTRIGSGGNGECKQLDRGQNFWWGVLD